MSKDHMINLGMKTDFRARRTAGSARGLISRAACRGGGDSSPSAAPAKLPPSAPATCGGSSPAEFLRLLLPHVEGGLALDAAVRCVGTLSRKRLARLLTLIPKAKRTKLNSAGKLRHLLNLPEHRLALRRKRRQSWCSSAAGARRLNRLAPPARLHLLNTYTALRDGGTCGRLAAQRAGASVPTLWRWQRRYAKAGLAGLAPRFHRSGRKPALIVSVPSTVLACVRRLNVERGGNLPAWRAYLASAQCPPDIRAALQGKAIPAALLKATRLTRSKVTCHVGEGLLAVGPLPGRALKFYFLNA